MESVAQAATILMAMIAVVGFVRGAQYVSRRRETSRPLAAQAYEEAKLAVDALDQDRLFNAAVHDRWNRDTAPVVDKAKATLSRVVIEGRWAVRRKARKLSDKLTETRNLAYAVVGLIKSAGTRQEVALERYEVLHQKLVEALEDYEKAARR